MLPCQDNYTTTFSSYPDMLRYHKLLEAESTWKRCQVAQLTVEPLGPNSPLRTNQAAFASEVSETAIDDTANNLGLALRVDGQLYPLRETAYKTLLERAKLNGSILPRLTREELASVLNMCLSHVKPNALALILVRDEKISATHSGDVRDYSMLPMDQLLTALEQKMDDRFPGSHFEGGYSDHAYSSACWTFPAQKDDLLKSYSKVLASHGKTGMANKIMPGIRFTTSDTGLSSAKVSAMLMGLQHPIHIGGCVFVDHRCEKQVSDFEKELDLLFAQFVDSVAKLQRLLDIQLSYPINAMTRVCQKLKLPKKEADEAIYMFSVAFSGCTATAHDVFMAMQEIPFLMKSNGAPEAKRLQIEENMARALSVRWSDYDTARAVSA